MVTDALFVEILAHIDQTANAWRHEEYEHITRGNQEMAEKCHLGAVQAEQLARTIRERVIYDR